MVRLYSPLASVVGSRVARVAGGVPLPEARVNGGEPGALDCAVTVQDAMVCPAGGVRLAVTGTGARTMVPSAGVLAPMVGGGPEAGAVQVTLTRLDVAWV